MSCTSDLIDVGCERNSGVHRSGNVDRHRRIWRQGLRYMARIGLRHHGAPSEGELESITFLLRFLPAFAGVHGGLDILNLGVGISSIQPPQISDHEERAR